MGILAILDKKHILVYNALGFQRVDYRKNTEKTLNQSVLISLDGYKKERIVMTVITVFNDQNRKPSTDEKVAFSDRIWELQRRFREGSLNPEIVLGNVQLTSERHAMVSEKYLETRRQRMFSATLKKMDSTMSVPAEPQMSLEDALGEEFWSHHNLTMADRYSIAPSSEGGLVTCSKIITEYAECRDITGAILGIPVGDDSEHTARIKSFHPKQVMDIVRRVNRGEGKSPFTVKGQNIFLVSTYDNLLCFSVYWGDSSFQLGIFHFAGSSQFDRGSRFFNFEGNT